MANTSGLGLFGEMVEILFEVAEKTIQEKRYSDLDYDGFRNVPFIHEVKLKSEIAEQEKTKPLTESKPIHIPLIYMNEEPIEKKTSTFSLTATQIKLEVLLLSYLFHEDDGKISKIEKRNIKNHYKKYKYKLNSEDIKEIKEMGQLDKSLMNIRGYISQNSVTETDIENALKTTKEIAKDKKKYQSIVTRIENFLLDAIRY